MPHNFIFNPNKNGTDKKQTQSQRRLLPSPPVTGVMPVKQLIVVVFPAPLGPRRQNN